MSRNHRLQPPNSTSSLKSIARPLLSFPPDELPTSAMSPFQQTFPLPKSRMTAIITFLPMCFIASVLVFSFYAYFISLVLLYLVRRSPWRALLLGSIFLFLFFGCSSSVVVAHLRSGGDVPGLASSTARRGRRNNGATKTPKELEDGLLSTREQDGDREEEDTRFVIDDDDNDAEGEDSDEERDRLLSSPRNSTSPALDRPGQGRKMIARDATTRSERPTNRQGSSALDMVAALRDLDASAAGREESEWGAYGPKGTIQVKGDGSSRYCRKCRVHKPDRAHHCSSCGKCVLKMDHHCPWLGGACVGYSNYKSFLLFLLYGGALGVFVGTTTIIELMNYVDDGEENFELAPISWALIMILGFVFGFCMTLFGLYHMYLAGRNRTTIETMERPSYAPLSSGPGPNGLPLRFKNDAALTRAERRKLRKAADRFHVYDMGVKENLRQIFGGADQKWLWFFPFGNPSPGDGTSFPIDREKLRRLREITTEVRLQVESGSSTTTSDFSDNDR
ncbi:zf-DHHC-domain-containing protein [Meredithblackwellia eburnea MCA 4105]